MGYMMKTTYFPLFLILGIFFIFGCAITDDEDPGKKPTIRAVYFYKDAAAVPTSNFKVGDNITIAVHLEDPDLDILTLHVVIYDLSDPGSVYDGPTVYEMEAATQPEYRISETLDVNFSAGEYRVDFQAVDEKGNYSLIFRKRLYVL